MKVRRLIGSMIGILILGSFAAGCAPSDSPAGPPSPIIGPPPAGASITVTASPTSISISGQTIITATVRDASGNLVIDGTAVTFTLSSSAMGTLSGGGNATTTGGTAVVTLTASTIAGSLRITATSSGQTSSVTITINASPPQDMNLTATLTSVPATSTTTISAYVVDSIGNPVANTSVSFGLDSGLKGRLASSSAITGTNGVATVVFTAGNSTTIATITASIGSISKNIQITITGGLGGGSVTVQVNPAALIAGGTPNTSSITATIRDSNNNLVAGAPVTFSLSNNAANFSGNATQTANSGTCPGATCGIATVTLTAVSASPSVTVFADALGIQGSANITIAASSSVGTITAAASPVVILTSGSSIITANLLDSSGNPRVGATVNFDVNDPSLVDLVDVTTGLAAASAVTGPTGNAQIRVNAEGYAGGVVVTATYSTLSATANVTITVPPPASVTVATNPTSILVLGTATITATVRDAGGNTVPDGAPVTFSVNDPTLGSLSNTLTSTGSNNGTATTTFIAANKAGTVQITATAGSGSSTVSNNPPATLNIVPASTGSIQFVSANPQVIGLAGSGQVQTSSVTFFVKDINGNAAVDGTSVTFSMIGPGGGEYITGSVPGATVATSSTVSGSATVTLHSGAVAGPVTIIARTYVNTVGVQTTINNTGGINATVGTIPVTSAASFPSSGIIKIDNELITYASKDATNFYGCTRGAISTLAASHLDGVQVFNQDTIAANAAQISIGGGVPSATHFGLATSQFNLAGLTTYGLTANITAYLADRFGNFNILNGTSVSFYTEGGGINRQGTTDSTGKTSVVIQTQSPQPDDVMNTRTTDSDYAAIGYWAGLGNEPWRLGNAYRYNPRDGWVTVLATTMGEEAFIDENGNGMFTYHYCDTAAATCNDACPAGYTCECPGQTPAFVTGGGTCATFRSEGFIDIGEAFYDVNDNGTWDSGVTGGHPFEQFIDANGNGAYDSPNSVWDGPECQSSGCLKSKMIWKDIRLVFSGDYFFWPDPDGNECYSLATELPLNTCTATYAAGSSDYASASASIVKGSSGNFCVIIGDRNLNRLPGGTVITASASPAKSVTPSSVTLLDRLSTGPTKFCFTVSIDATTTDSVTVVSAGVQGTPPAIINVPLINPPLAIQTSVLPNGRVSTGYTASVAVTGGTAPYAWALTAGSLPTGLTLDPSTGIISGTPTVVEVASFTVQVTDSAATVRTRNFTITINP